MLLESLTTCAGIAMSFGYYPQAYKLWRTKDARPISLPSSILFAGGTSIWTLYGFLRMDWAIIASFSFGMIGSWLVLILTLFFQRYVTTHPKE
jgi:MtN3 and saliva related transmembrane protein